MRKQKLIIEVDENVKPHVALRACGHVLEKGLIGFANKNPFYQGLTFFTSDISVRCTPVRDSNAIKLVVFIDTEQFGERQLL